MKKVYLLTALLIALNSLAAARIAAGLISYRLARTTPHAAPGTTGAPASAVSDDFLSFAPILDQGLFGRATQGKLTPLSAPVQGSAGPQQPAQPHGDLTLLGTARGSFRETFALIRRATPPEERVFRLGDTVFGVGPLVGVQKESVEILANGRKVRLTTPLAMGIEPTSPPSPQGAVPQSGAVQVGAGSYVIDQRALNAALDNLGQVMTDARLLPSVKEGKVEGFRISEVKPSGVFSMIGMRNGDVLLRINDLPVDSPERAIQSLASLKGQNRIKLDLVRDGQPTTFSYDIR
jgi:general secretion pathway protein C